MSQYLGNLATILLAAEPFKHWPVERSVDDDSVPPEVRYRFVGRSLELNCDRHDERIRCIFLREDVHDKVALFEMPFHLTRAEVLSMHGPPTNSGEGFTHPLLGEFGAWDRFRCIDHTLHVQYKVGENGISLITLMRNDCVP